MATGKLQLNKIIASDKSVIFQTDAGTFIAHNEPTIIMNPIADVNAKYNKWNFNVSDRNIMFSNMYPLSSFKAQSYQYKKELKYRQNNIDDFLNVYGPTESFNKGCQYLNNGYILSDITDKCITAEVTQFNDDIFSTPYLTSIAFPVKTYVYPSRSIIESDTTSGVTTFIPLYNLSGIYFNYIEELPLEFSYYGFDNSSQLSAYNYVFADTINAKNQYDHNYDVSSYITSTSDTQTVSGYLTNARTYYDIGSTGDVLYMVYRTNRKYECDSTSLVGTNVTFGMTPTSSFASSGDIVDLNMLNSSTLSTYVINTYDNVETIQSINRIQSNEGHTSNLFSINIQNSNIASSSLSASIKEEIQKNLNNIIENVIKNIIPANTQLFKIYWNGE